MKTHVYFYKLNCSLLKAAIGSATFTGLFIGSNFWGNFGDRFGRKKGILFMSIICLIFAIASAFSPNVYVLIILRFCLGIGLGGSTVIFTILAEYLPDAGRAKILTNFGIFWVVGTCFEILVAYLVISKFNLGWRALLLVSALPILILMPMYLLLKEPPRFLLSSNRAEEANDTLHYIAKKCKKELPDDFKLSEHNPNKTNKTNFLALLSPRFRKLSILLWIIWFSSNLSYYGITLFTPIYFEKLAGGKIGSTSTTYYLFVFATSIAEIPGLLTCSIGVEFIGRKNTQTLSLGLCAVILYVLMLDIPLLASIIMLIFARMFIAGASSTAWSYTPEAYPTFIRATGVGTAGGFAKFGSIFSPFLSIALEDKSPRFSLMAFAALGTISSICSFLLPKDGVDIHMDEEFKRENEMSSEVSLLMVMKE